MKKCKHLLTNTENQIYDENNCKTPNKVYFSFKNGKFRVRINRMKKMKFETNGGN